MCRAQNTSSTADASAKSKKTTCETQMRELVCPPLMLTALNLPLSLTEALAHGSHLVMAIAALAYLAKISGMGEIKLDGRKLPIIWYIDWITTTPLMLFELEVPRSTQPFLSSVAIC